MYTQEIFSLCSLHYLSFTCDYFTGPVYNAAEFVDIYAFIIHIFCEKAKHLLLINT